MNLHLLDLREKAAFKISQLVSRLIGLKHLGRNSVIMLPFTKIQGAQYICIGDESYIGRGVYFSVDSVPGEDKHPPKLVIGDRVQIGNYLTVACINLIQIGDDVMMSDRVFIGDSKHSYTDPHLSVSQQPLISKDSVEIGEGAFIGINAVVMPGVRIGAHAIIGASSVVVRDVPAYSVVAGNPARLIKCFDRETGQWLKVKGQDS
jgi:acetyltransferase-like isoleucine patch superfamily enzyme